MNTYPKGKRPTEYTDKRSASTELILKALTDSENPLSLLPDAEVRRVLFDEGTCKVQGVEVKLRQPAAIAGIIADPNGLKLPAGELVTIRARKVTISAGSPGSPAILLRSKIPNDQIGRGAVMHASMPVLGTYENEVNVLAGTQASVFVDDFLIKNG